MVYFIVLATQRTGSSFLGSSLNSHPDIVCCEELFMPRNTNPVTYRSYRARSIRRRIKHIFAQSRLVNAYIGETITATAAGSKAWGFSLMYNQIRRYPATAQWCRTSDVRIIHLVRRNALKVLVSRAVAKKRKAGNTEGPVYLSTKPLAHTTISLNVPTLLNDLSELTASVEKHRRMFADRNPLEVQYESLLAHPDSEIEKVLDYLNVRYAPLKSNLIKTSPDSLSMIVENYDAVRSALVGTVYEKHLD